MLSIPRPIHIILGIVFAIVAMQALIPRTYTPRPKEPVVQGQCIGEPIPVDFAYTGGVNDPWTCQVQCDDDEPRFILYGNGQATQCETPPGCNDTGEDTGVTCIPPLASGAE